MDNFYGFSVRCAVMAAVMAMPAIGFAQSEVTLFHEDFGTASSEKDEPLEEHVWAVNSPGMFSWTADAESGSSLNVRTNNPSGYDGASADGNLYFKGYATFTVSGIDAVGASGLKLSLGAFGKNAADDYKESKGEVMVADVDCMKITCTTGGNTTEVADFSKMNLDRGSKAWTWLGGISLPDADGQLSLTMASAIPNEDGGIRLDDITVTGMRTASGIDNATANPTLLYWDGHTLSYRAEGGVARVYTAAGSLAASVKAGQPAWLNLAKGMYVAKAGNATLKFIVR